jgi:Glycine cleavage system protein P (pyridoxal-binding), N-terminal domain
MTMITNSSSVPPRILLFPTIHPEYRAVVRTYVQHLDVRLEGDEGWTREQLREPLAVLEALEARLDGETAALVIPYPDFLGRVLPPARLRETADRVHRAGGGSSRVDLQACKLGTGRRFTTS